MFDLFGHSHRPVVRHPHTAGVRSARLADEIETLAAAARTPVQQRLLQQHWRGECVGCTRQGVPLDLSGSEVPYHYEANGFAAPLEQDYCDCPKGQLYRRWVASRRASYDGERLAEHERHLRMLFGAGCRLPPVMAGWTIESWPVEPSSRLAEAPFPEAVWNEELEEVRSMRTLVQMCVRSYAEQFVCWDEGVSKPGMGFLGGPGVGKSGLLRALEPSARAANKSMISLYVPDLVIALESEQMEQMLAMLRATNIVLLDNLGFTVSLGYRESAGRLALIRLINARWERQQATLFTSNVTEEQLIEQLGEDSVSRLHALCRFFEVPGADLRRGREE